VDCGACLGCGLGFNPPLQTDNDQDITWESEQPNPLPIFKAPDEFYTPLLLPGLYLPGRLIAPYHEEGGLLYQPLSDADLVDILIAFAIHESVHQTLFLGIIPTTLRLAAAHFYSTLAILLSRSFDSHLWDVLNHVNYVIEVVHNATAAMHEVAAIVENQVTTLFNNPYIQRLSEKSAINYAQDQNYGSDFILYYETFHSLIAVLKEQFAPTPLQRNTILTLADYIISSAIDLQGLADDVLKVPLPIADTSLREYFGRVGIPYLEGGKKRTLSRCPELQLGFGGFTVYGTGRRLERTMETIRSVKFKRQRKMPKHYRDQLLYIAEFIPELKLWLETVGARDWVKRRILNAIADRQLYLEHYGISLPLTTVWESDLSAYISIKTGFMGKTLYTVGVGNQPEGFIARAAKIPHDHWITYCIQKDEPLGVIFSPRCGDGIPLSPFGHVLYTDDSIELARRLYTFIVFESLRMQLAAGRGVICPWYGSRLNGKDSYCCGRADTLWQVYYLGLKAAEEGGWKPKQWIKPECKLPKTKIPPRGKATLGNISTDSNIFL
jgi:hypothetical protein